MKYEVIGFQRKTGTFTDEKSGKTYDFDNFNLHCIGHSMEVTGKAVREVKLKVAAAAELIAAVGGKPEQLIGHTVDFEFGSYGKVAGYELVK